MTDMRRGQARTLPSQCLPSAGNLHCRCRAAVASTSHRRIRALPAAAQCAQDHRRDERYERGDIYEEEAYAGRRRRSSDETACPGQGHDEYIVCVLAMPYDIIRGLTQRIVRANMDASEKDRLPDDELIAQMNTLIFAAHVCPSQQITVPTPSR